MNKFTATKNAEVDMAKYIKPLFTMKWMMYDTVLAVGILIGILAQH